jgi:hypothetical protein
LLDRWGRQDGELVISGGSEFETQETPAGDEEGGTMRKRIGTTVVVALLAVAFGGVLRTATAGSSLATTEIVVVMTDDTQVRTFLDFFEDGRTQGDRLVSRGPLFNLAETQQVGRAFGECVVVSNRITATAGLWRCSYLLELADGDLIVEGLDPRGPGPYTMAILGGTEDYRTAAGHADFMDTPTRTEMYLHVEI